MNTAVRNRVDRGVRGFITERTGALLVVVVALVTWLPRAAGPIDLRWDAGVYYVLGTSLAEGRGYRLLNEPGEIRAVQYPPLLPAIVALHERALRTSDPVRVGRALRLTFAVFFALYALAAYAVLRRVLAVPWAAAAGIVAVVNVQAIWVSDRCYADIPFAVATLAAIRLNTGADRRPLAAGIAAAAAALLRAIGAAMVVALIVDAALRRDRRTWAAAIIGVTALGAWSAYAFVVERREINVAPAYSYQLAASNFYNVSYTRNLLNDDPGAAASTAAVPGQLAARIGANALALPFAAGEAILMNQEAWVPALERVKRTPVLRRLVPWAAVDVMLALGGMAALAGLVVAFGWRSFPLVYVAASLGLLCLLPWRNEWLRYEVPLVPLLTAGWIVGLRWVAARVGPPRVARRLAPVALTFVAAVNAVAVVRSFGPGSYPQVAYHDRNGRNVTYRLFSYSANSAALDRAIDWVGAHAAAADIVSAALPHWVFLRTGRRAVLPPFEPDPRLASHELASVPVRYVIIDMADESSAAREYAAPAVFTAPGRWRQVFDADERVFVYERVDRAGRVSAPPSISSR